MLFSGSETSICIFLIYYNSICTPACFNYSMVNFILFDMENHLIDNQFLQNGRVAVVQMEIINSGRVPLAIDFDF